MVPLSPQSLIISARTLALLGAQDDYTFGDAPPRPLQARASEHGSPERWDLRFVPARRAGAGRCVSRLPSADEDVHPGGGHRLGGGAGAVRWPDPVLRRLYYSRRHRRDRVSGAWPDDAPEPAAVGGAR